MVQRATQNRESAHTTTALSGTIAGPTTAFDKDQTPQHDLVFKTVFRHFFADLLRIVEPDFAARVDLDKIEFLEQETFSDYPGGTRKTADLVAKLTSRDGEGRIVLVQTEVESRFRSEMDERGFYYYLYLRAKYRVPVLLIVVYLRGGKKKSFEMREYVDRAEGVEVCRFRYAAFFLGQSRAEDFVDRPQPLAPGLATLMRSDWDPVEKKLQCLRSIRNADLDDAKHFLLARLADLYIKLNAVQAERFANELAKEENEEVRDMVITLEDAIRAGEERGMDAMRRSIVRVLKRRLESVPAYVREKLEAVGSVDRLEEILDQALTVDSIDELALES